MIVSVTPELALDEVPIYAGGLGVLEGDKFIEASESKLPYTVITLFYPKGYANYFVDDEIREELLDYSEIEKKLKSEGEIEINTKPGKVRLRVLTLTKGNAKAVFFKALSPDWAVRVTSRLYVDEDRFDYEYTYIILAKASVEYINSLNNVKAVYAQESLAGLSLIPLHGKYETHLTTHTPGPWGHPYFSSQTLKDEFGIEAQGDVMLTRLLLKYADYVHTVSYKHNHLTKLMLPEANPTPLTNGVSFTRWMHDEIRKIYSQKKYEMLVNAKKKAKEDLLKLLNNYKKVNGDFIVVWARRITKYKRPYFITRLIREVGRDLNVTFIVGGIAHPKDPEGIGYMREFNQLQREYKNVVYVYDYNLSNAKYVLSGGDLLLFTPFSSWEACGTSYMKAGINGVPTLSSRDGGALEVIIDGYNGWLFGDDIREFVDIYNSQKAKEIDERDYKEFKSKFLRILEKAESDKDWYNEVIKNAFTSFTSYTNIKRVLDMIY
ncbi:glycosyl transferase [Sulfolobus sp. A20]|uniref:glycogen/starch/alpha-glucan phosphorylase n=1 Tax=Sulfolobaceae TaxID=118883 RepID=UPI00084602C6|nr:MULTISPECIES: glycogen/starch/alpha-glucan phosphorylase [unclassified Sulfolobus]TRM75582.1 glycosyl transferase [Sulfolobus sp. E5]TRM76283.1 glycosyl transferase [Sulfolobus sp. A20-N-F8]TRM77409.1 glycosyl transferase [Sulfolobus sp. B5]TRM80305.1 glycosyl transferase [Sulfolobus sp. D5]TRM83814.1 glycosyl transferase [Sulfolobus sp. A20-N-F6]TRM89680.1 glycosyl transferase [Sulfolobus sp. C3]TRN01732.1 glycosyl transferase [Sulfolobus sp. E1]